MALFWVSGQLVFRGGSNASGSFSSFHLCGHLPGQHTELALDVCC